MTDDDKTLIERLRQQGNWYVDNAYNLPLRAADRIEALTAEKQKMALDYLALDGQAVELMDKVNALTAEVAHLKDVYESATGCFLEAQTEVERLREALVRLRDCDWVITPLDRMDEVRNIARAALEIKQ